MTNLIVPDTVASQLEGLPSPVHLNDATGRMLGYFVPAIDSSRYEVIGPEPSQEELRQIEQSSEWYTTDQVLQHLERLT